MVAGSVLVPSSPRVGGGRAKGVASIPQPANEQRPSTRPPQQLAHSDCVEVIRQCFQDKGLSGSVFTLLLGANRATSKSSYKSAWNGSFNWCSERDIILWSNDLATVLQYLRNLHIKGSATCSFNVHRSMLSVTLDTVDG